MARRGSRAVTSVRPDNNQQSGGIFSKRRRGTQQVSHHCGEGGPICLRLACAPTRFCVYVAYRFQADEDGTYLVSVTDQFNSSSDDPRLVYRLSVRAEQPDFQLVAFANPERHADEKITKPNGVSLLPGGSAVVRVRLLPRHGFNETVQVTASDLPHGVTAHPLTLNSRQREGFLILTVKSQPM